MIAFDLIGQTPLVLLESFSDERIQIYAKLEQFNPGGSVKDRLGKNLIEKAIKDGRLKKGGTIVEASAGNTGTGIGLAIAANRYKVKCVIFAPKGFAEEKNFTMKALGADVRRTQKSEGMIGAQGEAKTYAKKYNALYMNQFGSEANAYTYTLAQSLTEQLNHIDYFVARVGSGGTFTGVAQHLKDYQVKNYIVEPEGSVLNGGPSHAHDTEGIGSEKWPSFLNKKLVDGIFTIKDQDVFNNVKLLEILVGNSLGAALQGALELKKQVQQGVIVTILPDGSDRYMSKQIFNYKESNDYE